MLDQRKCTVAVSVLVPTKNEERNIEACLASVAFAGECVVFDSHSTDRTVEIATAMGARVVARRFDYFSKHKNWALQHIDWRYEWVFILDADERVTADLERDIRQIVEKSGPLDGYYVARKNFFRGRWVRYGGMYPDWQLRLFRRGAALYEDRIVHEHMLVHGAVGHLSSDLVHDDDKGIERYIDRHNTYSSFEAVEAYRLLNGRLGESIDVDVYSQGPGRRRALKNFAYRWVPARWLFVFFYMYFWRMGIRDGRAGFVYCVLRMFYEFQVDVKLHELRDRQSPLYIKHKSLIER